MRYGDLSNVVAPKLLIVFEGGIASGPDSGLKEYEKALSKGDWRAAVRMFELREPVIQRILHLAFAKDFNISVVTWLGFNAEQGAAAADEIENIMAENSVPVRSCFRSTPDQLARMLPYNPDIRCVYDPDPSHILKFGSRGSVLTDPNLIGSMFR
jgi:hypothetical protein